MFYRYGAMAFALCFLEPLFTIAGFINVTIYSSQVCPSHGSQYMIKNIRKKSYWQIQSFTKLGLKMNVLIIRYFGNHILLLLHKVYFY
jgi:hypothetical protein